MAASEIKLRCPMSWRDRPFMGLDFESTGISVETERIVTGCLGLASPQGWVPRNWLLTQSEPIPQAATDVHGITTEYANEHGMDPATALQQLVDDLYKGWSMGLPVVGYNIVFDLTILDRNLRRLDLAPLEVAGPVIDPLVIDKAVDPYRRGSRKLIDVCAHYGITLTDEDAHGAEPDARAACRLAWKLGGHPTIGQKTLEDLHSWQALAYAEQRASFAAYLAKQGNALDDDNRVWPLKPLASAVRQPAA